MSLLKKVLEKVLPHSLLASMDARSWDKRWRHKDFAIAWRLADVDPILVEAERAGWFPAGGSILDVGCGDGVHAAWLGDQGFTVVGIDIAEAAVEIANRNCAGPNTSFEVCDISQELPSVTGFDAVLDRGCFHQMRPAQRPRMVANVLRAVNAGATVILMAKVFRNAGDTFEKVSEERKNEIIESVEKLWGPYFEIVDRKLCHFDPKEKSLPGFVFYMRALPEPTTG